MTKLDKALAVAEGVAIRLDQALAQTELDKKKTHKPTIPHGASHPGHKPHGQVKPRQQRGTAHGQRVAKQSFASSPADPKRGELPKPPKTTPEHGLGEGWQHSHGSASNRWSHGHAFGSHANRRGSTVKKPKMNECESTLKQASDELAKARTYLSEGEKPPKGAEKKEGPRGGWYYDSGSAAAPGGETHHGERGVPHTHNTGTPEEFSHTHGHRLNHPGPESEGPGKSSSKEKKYPIGTENENAETRTRARRATELSHKPGKEHNVTDRQAQPDPDPDNEKRVQRWDELARQPKDELLRILTRSGMHSLTLNDPKKDVIAAIVDREFYRLRPRRQRRLKKQHPSEYPQEWGPKTLYAKIEEEAAGLEKLLKAGGCPQGQHKHAPYDYCHPSDRKHHGYTDEKPSGPMDEVYGVLDAAIVEAKGMGAEGMAVALEVVKGKLDPEARPDQVVQQLMAVANSYTEAAKQGATSPNMRMRAQAMGYKKVADTLRRAAKKLAAPAEEKPSGPFVPENPHKALYDYARKEKQLRDSIKHGRGNFEHNQFALQKVVQRQKELRGQIAQRDKEEGRGIWETQRRGGA